MFLEEFFFCQYSYDLLTWIMHEVSDLSYDIDV